MAILLETRPANGPITRTPLEPGRNTFRAQPNARYRIVDEAGTKIDEGVIIKRVGNDLIVTGLPEERLVEFDGFFLRCTPKNPCELMLENLGGKTPMASITPISEPVAALRDGSFLMYQGRSVADAVPIPLAPEAETSSTFKSVGMVVAGLAIVGAAAGGGGGGGGGGGSSAPDSSAPETPLLTSGTSSKSVRPVFTGTAEPNSQVSVFVDVDRNGTFSARYTVQVASDGSWRVDTATMIPAGGIMRDLPADTPTAVRVISVDASNNVSPPLTFQLFVDTTPPAAPTLAAVADDNIVNGSERAAGVTLGGTAEPGSTVLITWGSYIRTVTADSNGTWTSRVAAGEVPQDNPDSIITVLARDSAGNESVTTSRQVVIDSSSLLVIGPVAGDGVVNAAERSAGVTVTGTARPGTSVTLSWGSATLAPVVADGSGNWSATFAPGQVPPDAASTTLTARAQDTLGNVEVRTRDVAVDSVGPLPPVISDDTGAAVTNQPVTFTFAFAEPPGAFSAASIDVSGGTAGAFTMIDATHYSLVVNPVLGVQSGVIQVTLPPGRTSDAAGNPNTASASASQSYDTQPPGAPTITDNAPLSHSPGPVTFTFAFGEAPATGSFTIDDVAVSGGTKGTFSQLDATHYTLVVNTTGATGTIDIAVAGGSFTDTLGNVGTGNATASQPFNTQLPSLVISDNQPGAITNGATRFDFTLSEAPGANGFTSGDIAVSGGTRGAFTMIDATHYSLLVTPTANTNSGTMQVSVVANAFDNNAGTTNPAGATASQAYDTAAPTQTLSLFTVLDDQGLAQGQLSNGDITDDNSMDFSFTLSAALNSGESFQVLRDGAVVFTGTTSSIFAFTDNVASRPLNDYQYTARVVDLAGNVDNLGMTFGITVI